MSKTLLRRSTALSLTALVLFSALTLPVRAEDVPACDPGADEAFSDFLSEDFKDTLTSDYTKLHQYLSDPEGYGISRDDYTVSLGDPYVTDADREDLADLEDTLTAFEDSDLSARQERIYREYQFENGIADTLYAKDNQYFSNLWSSQTGLPVSLFGYFSDTFVCYDEQDIEDLLTLLADVPRYTKEAISYTKEQAKAGELYLDTDDAISAIDTVLDGQDDSAVYTHLCDTIESLKGLSKKNIRSYEKKVQKALDEDFYPSYEKMKSCLEDLEKSGEIREPTGLANRDGGQAYYEALVQSACSDTINVEDLYDTLLSRYNDDVDQLASLEKKDKGIASENPNTGLSTPEELLDFLNSSCTKLFPAVSDMTWNIEPLSDEQSVDTVVAYYTVPPLDVDGNNQIRYNPSYASDGFQTLYCYQTFAHEGIPGHMYAYSYLRDHMVYDIEYLLGESAVVEGYATYAAQQAMQFLTDIDDDVITYYTLNDEAQGLMLCLMDIDINYYGDDLDTLKERYHFLDESSVESCYASLSEEPTMYLPYYYGLLRISAYQDMAKQMLGDRYNDVQFNNALLSCGNVNFTIIDDVMARYLVTAQGASVLPFLTDEEPQIALKKEAFTGLHTA